MKDLDKVLENFRTIDFLLQTRQLGIDSKQAVVTLTATLFSQMSRSNGRPSQMAFIHFLDNLRAYINFQRGYRIGADGQALEEGDTSGLLRNKNTLRGYVVDSNATPVITFEHERGSLKIERIKI